MSKRKRQKTYTTQEVIDKIFDSDDDNFIVLQGDEKERWKTDRFAPFRGVFEIFNNNCAFISNW